ncbi:MAG: flagellar motor protein MotB [Bryobacteraceae bacterium]
MNQQQAPIIIIKKKGGHAGHHGGAWKVAYADFVTAMMALFIVLWLLNSNVQVRKAISAYFNDPSGTGKESGSSAAGSGESVAVSMDDMDNLKEKLEQAIKQKPEFEKLKDYMQLSVTGEGLRVELLESEKGMFFQSGSAAPSDMGEELINKLADQLVKLPNTLLIEGHTDAKAFGGRTNYSNWELSTDRANAARRIIETHGSRPGQIVQVRGFADQNLRDREHPEDAKNRRVSVIVRYQNAPPTDPAGEASAEGSAEGKGETKAGEHGKAEAKADSVHEEKHSAEKPQAEHAAPKH